MIKFFLLFLRVKMEILFIYILYLSMLHKDKSLIFPLIDLSKSFVIQGFKSCFVLRFEMNFNSTC